MFTQARRATTTCGRSPAAFGSTSPSTTWTPSTTSCWAETTCSTSSRILGPTSTARRSKTSGTSETVCKSYSHETNVIHKHVYDYCTGLYIGRIFQPPNQIVFNSGGAGYTLDTKALKVSQNSSIAFAFRTYKHSCYGLSCNPVTARQHRHSEMLPASARVTEKTTLYVSEYLLCLILVVDPDRFWEDVNTANCLKTQQIVPYDTRDSQER